MQIQQHLGLQSQDVPRNRKGRNDIWWEFPWLQRHEATDLRSAIVQNKIIQRTLCLLGVRQIYWNPKTKRNVFMTSQRKTVSLQQRQWKPYSVEEEHLHRSEKKKKKKSLLQRTVNPGQSPQQWTWNKNVFRSLEPKRIYNRLALNEIQCCENTFPRGDANITYFPSQGPSEKQSVHPGEPVSLRRAYLEHGWGALQDSGGPQRSIGKSSPNMDDGYENKTKLYNLPKEISEAKGI